MIADYVEVDKGPSAREENGDANGHGSESVKRITVSSPYCTAVGNPRLRRFSRTKSENYVFPRDRGLREQGVFELKAITYQFRGNQ